PYTLRPFSEPELDKATPLDRKRMRDFNYKLSSVCISVEHAFGQLKGRFPSLRCMGAHEDIHEVYRVIEALLILHNMCLYHNDSPKDILDSLFDDELFRDGEGWDSVVIGDVSAPTNETEARLKEAGYRMRMQILNEVFPVHLYEV
ncbi:hypothetical protein K435DRAFT_672379, partial [Dendrothele bispora CBS 962.96]